MIVWFLKGCCFAFEAKLPNSNLIKAVRCFHMKKNFENFKEFLPITYVLPSILLKESSEKKRFCAIELNGLPLKTIEIEQINFLTSGLLYYIVNGFSEEISKNRVNWRKTIFMK